MPRKPPPGPGPGRPKGLQNKVTIQVKEALLWAAEAIGGRERLVAWIKADPENEKIYWRDMFCRMLPLEAAVTHRNAMADMTHQELVEFIARKANETNTSMKLIVDGRKDDEGTSPV